MKLAVVIQARMGSTRLPDKIMKPLAGEPALLRMLQRVAAAKTPFELIVATTTDDADQPIRDLCEDNGFHWYNGHPTDCLDRHVQAARSLDADAVVKIPSDCPLIDPEVIDQVLGYFSSHAGEVDFVSNLHPPTHPDGNDVEVMPLSVLEVAWREAKKSFEREHTTPFIWDQPERFRCVNIEWSTGLDYSKSHRFVLDYPEDYEFISAVYDALYSDDRPVFSLADILALLERQPELRAINAMHADYQWYNSHADELKTLSLS